MYPALPTAPRARREAERGQRRTIDDASTSREDVGDRSQTRGERGCRVREPRRSIAAAAENAQPLVRAGHEHDEHGDEKERGDRRVEIVVRDEVPEIARGFDAGWQRSG